MAQACLEYLYSPEGQDIAGHNCYRPIDPTAAAKFAKQYPKVNLFNIDEVFGGWERAQKTHFSDGGSLGIGRESSEVGLAEYVEYHGINVHR